MADNLYHDEHRFNGNLDLESDGRDIMPGWYTYALNAIIGATDRRFSGDVESVRGNVELDRLWFLFGYIPFSLPEGDNLVIGSCADIKNQAIIWANCNSNGNHGIYRYFIKENFIEYLINPFTWGPILNFDPDYKLFNMFIVYTGQNKLWDNGVGESHPVFGVELPEQLLFFTDNLNPPRRLNTADWLSSVIGNVESYTPDQYQFNVAKRPAAFKPPSPAGWFPAPVVVFVNNGHLTNFIADKNFQFRYNYLYKDNEISTWSAMSEISIPPQDGQEYNSLAVYFDTGDINVVKVQIAMREGNGSSDTGTENPEWYIFNVFDVVDHNSSTNVSFNNTETLTPIARIDTDKNFELVPQLAGQQEIVEQNQVVYGNITEGYDNLDVSTQLTVQYAQSGIILFPNVTTHTNQVDLTGIVLPRAGDTLTFSWNNTNATLTTQLDSFDVASINNLGNKIVDAFNLLADNIFLAYNSSTHIVTGSAGVTSMVIYTVRGTTPGGSLKELLLLDATTNSTFTQNIGPLTTGNLFLANLVTQAAPFVGSVFLSIPSSFLNYHILRHTLSIKLRFSGSSSPRNARIDVANSGGIIYSKTVTLTGPETFNLGSSLLISPFLGGNFHIDVVNLDASVTLQVENVSELKVWVDQLEYLPTGFKSGSNATFGVVYYDEYLRSTGVQGKADIYVPFLTERTWQNDFETVTPAKGFIPNIAWSIFSLPPIEAKYWQWLYAPDIEKFVQLMISQVSFTPPTPIVGFITAQFVLNNLNDYPYLEYKDFKAGDRVRLLYQAVTTGNGLNGNFLQHGIFNEKTPNTGYIEVVVVAFDAATNTLTVDNTEGLLNSQTLQAGIVVEIYFKEPLSPLLFEFNQIYEVGNAGLSNRYHKGETQNQDPDDPIGTPATGVFTKGNVYFKYRFLTVGTGTSPNAIVFVESAAISDFYPSSWWNKGRINLVIPEAHKIELGNMMRYSGKLFQNTLVNNTNVFDEGNYNIFQAKYGIITGLRQVGEVLKIVMWNNIVSMLIYKTQITNPDQTTQMILTNVLFSSTNYSADWYGSKHPSSITVRDRNLYCFDVIRKCVVRNDPNGSDDISRGGQTTPKKTARFWQQQSDIILENDMDVIMGYDDSKKLLYITARETGEPTDLSFTLSYREGEAWKSFHDHNTVSGEVITPIDLYAWCGSNMFMFINGVPWKSNALDDSGEDYLKLFGQDRFLKIGYMSVADPIKTKVFQTHTVHSNRRIDHSYESIPASETTLLGMASEIPGGKYVFKEGVWYVDMNRDYNTNGAPVDNAAKLNMLVNGQPMRGYEMDVLMQWIGNTIVTINSSSVGVQVSEKS